MASIKTVVKDIYDEIDRIIDILNSQFGIQVVKSSRLGLDEPEEPKASVPEAVKPVKKAKKTKKRKK